MARASTVHSLSFFLLSKTYLLNGTHLFTSECHSKFTCGCERGVYVCPASVARVLNSIVFVLQIHNGLSTAGMELIS